MLGQFTSTLGAAALMLALPGSPLDAQGKGKGNDKGNEKAQAAETRGGAKGRAERAEARTRDDRGKSADVSDKRGRSDDLNRHLLRNEGKIYLDFDGAQKPEEVGASVVRSLVRNRKERAVGFVSWWVWFGKHAWRRGVRRIMRKKVERFAKRAAG